MSEVNADPPEVLAMPAEGVPPLVDDAHALKEVKNRLATSSAPVAVDTERAQGYRYGSNAYLVQIRREDVGSFLIDSHALPDLTELRAVLEQKWILHAADQDLRCLLELGLKPESVFDTEIAARLLGFRKFSLTAVTEQVLNVKLEKSHQNEDWSRRPIPPDWLRYAALDVELLPALYDNLADQLEKSGRMDWAEQEFNHLLTHPLIPRVPAWRDLRGLGKIKTRRGLAYARELWRARETVGKKLDLAPGRLLATAGIIEAAQKLPKTRRDLQSIEAFRRPTARKEMQTWSSAITKAKALSDADLPALKVFPNMAVPPPANTWKRLDSEAWDRLTAVRAIVADAAKSLDLEPEVVLEPRVMREIAWRPLRGEITESLADSGARPWQQTLISQAIQSTSPSLLKTLQG